MIDKSYRVITTRIKFYPCSYKFDKCYNYMFWLCAAFYDVKKSTILHLYLTQRGQDLICGKSAADNDVGYKSI
nr:MAG TPA: hypothetical protein [Caudoviricetes sp.]